jgi:hypothetical protein
MACCQHPPDLGMMLLLLLLLLGTQQRVLLPAIKRGALFPGVLLLLTFCVRFVCVVHYLLFSTYYCYCHWDFQRRTNMCGGSLCERVVCHRPIPCPS